MSTTIPIAPRLAEQASRDYLAIVRAGREFELQREIELTIEAHEAARWLPNGRIDPEQQPLDQWRNAGGWYLREPNQQAAKLAGLLDCPVSSVSPYVVPELLPGDTRRTIVLTVLRDMAGRIATQQRQTARTRFATRRSA